MVCTIGSYLTAFFCGAIVATAVLGSLALYWWRRGR